MFNKLSDYNIIGLKLATNLKYMCIATIYLDYLNI